MSSLLVLGKWFEFSTKMGNALYPVTIVLIFFTLFRLKNFRNNPRLRFMLVAVIFVLSLRGMVFFAGILFAKRYLYPFVVLMLVFASIGLEPLSDFFHYIFSKVFKKVTTKQVGIVIVIIIFISCVGKIALPNFTKTWITEIGYDIKKMNKSGKSPILINDLDDKRVAYYAGAKYLKFSLPGDEISNVEKENMCTYGVIAKIGIIGNCGRYMALDMPKGIPAFTENVRKLGKERTFVLIKMEDAQFRKLFKTAKVDFEFQLIKTYRDHKKNILTLYKLK